MPAKASTSRRKSARPVWDGVPASKPVRARYDIAYTTSENENLWKYTDALSAAQANTPAVRKTIRQRARYEVANNSFADGIVETLSNDIVGSEVQLQLGDTDAAQRAEDAFARWASAVRLWEKVRTAVRAKTVDGEVFGLETTNRAVPGDIKLDLRLIECDQIESYYTGQAIKRSDEIDGIRFDADMNPTEYRVLKYHPGDYRINLAKSGGDWINARYVRHLFTATRPGQVRGVSELLPALSLFGELRLYTKAVLNSASRAAEVSGIVYTDMIPGEEMPTMAAGTEIEIVRNSLLSLPENWKLSQLKAEQPTTTYEMFRKAILNEIARCINMPYNIAACDSSGYNYASGRLDHQTYDRSIEVSRADLRAQMLDPILAAWLSEYASQNALSAAQIRELSDHEWHFSQRDHVDPAKEANADHVRFLNGSLTKAAYYAKRGKDWKREERQRIRELIESEKLWNEERKAAGLEPAAYPHTDMGAIPKAPEGDPDE